MQNIANLTIRADEIEGKVTAVEGNVGELQLTATSLTGRITSAEGNIGELQLTSNQFGVRLTDAEGNIGELQLTSTSLLLRVQNAELDIDNLQLNVSNLTTNIGTISGRIDNIDLDISGLKLATGAAKLEFSSDGLTIKNGGFNIKKGTSDVFYITSSGDIRMNGDLYNVVGNYGVRMYNGRLQFSSGNTSWGNFGAVCGDIYGVYTNMWPSPSNVYNIVIDGISQSTLKNQNGDARVAAYYNTVGINCSTLNINGSTYTKKKHSDVTNSEYVLVASS